jgi:uncharacterized protein (DUF362 family)/Pyruvate/2-oxoacid:ferredoxin oxidoreductase delta subunit
MARVIVRQSSYDYETLKQHCFSILDQFCGDLIRKDSFVVIKPNFLSAATPDKAILTHPMIIKCAAEFVLSKGVRPQISDSPAMGSFERILKESGVKHALEGLDVEFKEFKQSVKVDIGEPFGQIDMAEDAIRADVLINLPKLKTHSQMLLTLGVKNLFGCIAGYRKAEWHMRTGVDRHMFARLLFQIYRTLNPAVTIVDGILAMEGEGPGKSGLPKHLGVLIGSDNTVAVDMTICTMLGIEPEVLLTNEVSKELGFFNGSIEVDGDLPKIRGFSLPGITPLAIGPGWAQRFFRQHFLQRPEVDNSMCDLCGTCWEFCPAGALAESGDILRFDYDKCIRCFCCIEVCPSGALHIRETMGGKLLRKLTHKN